ncbi:hypothetical protein ON010_g2479 [Phytophthora cinnamomi]|nr:hypothetical protein ON010_g2479 [Phytophthora cinnamomi]
MRWGSCTSIDHVGDGRGGCGGRGLGGAPDHHDAQHRGGQVPDAPVCVQRGGVSGGGHGLVLLRVPAHHRLDVLQGPVQPLLGERLGPHVLADGLEPLLPHRGGSAVPTSGGARDLAFHEQVPALPAAAAEGVRDGGGRGGAGARGGHEVAGADKQKE